MNKVDQEYKKLVTKILENGTDKEDRTGVGTRSIFGYQMKIPISYNKFPILTLKKVIFRSVLYELLWFIRGDKNIDYLKENDVGIWDNWADEDGDVGPIYGYQWRSWPKSDGEEIDQLKNVINNINENPDSRRHVVSAWNAGQISEMALPPCHYSFEFYSKPLDYEERCEVFFDWHKGTHVAQQPLSEDTLEDYNIPKRELSCKINQRSVDVGIGLSYNISSYSLLTIFIAKLTEHVPGKLVHSMGDAHIYKNHFDKITKVLNKRSYSLPEIRVSNISDIDNISPEDIFLENYNSGQFVKMPVAV